MARLGKIAMGLTIGAALGLAVSLATGFASPLGSSASQPNGPGKLSPAELASFPDFPLYGLPGAIDGNSLTLASHVNASTLAAAAGGDTPTPTVGAQQLTSKRHGLTPNFVNLIYGTCHASDDSACAPPLAIQIWQSCNRTLGDYELAPGTPYPHTNLVVRGTQAAQFDEGRIEVYTGSVTIVLFGDKSLTSRAARELVPLNQAARSEQSHSGPDLAKPVVHPSCS